MEFLENNPIEYGEIISRTKIGILGDPNNSGKTTIVAFFLNNNKIKQIKLIL